ncbi:peptide/nickel transport system permease protein [Prauserella marina]|uniref:Peptide/nickel transport system permease protein n=2 Tax=Prauserella marina TaxID=530584 RepID=A0A1G6UK51_9PSEU|nr:ABC transporter ATP-binding protein [Prauserella marina]PWV74751.1 oligopeptide/dipeptide ABC transporter ATP-binding protein [Prauserella marina]SDD41644.1 peptide/nickel transport system permease protein [Prauserella marina]
MTILGARPQGRELSLADKVKTPILRISDLSVRFPERYGRVPVLDRVGLTVDRGECVAVVGESGCGKSLLGLSIANLLPTTAVVDGHVTFQGMDVHALDKKSARSLRGDRIGIIYQDALTSLNPGMSIGAQLRQVCRLGAGQQPEELLVSVGLDETSRFMKAKPYQLSGGQRQRVLIALALAREPELVIADEPTTALDLTVQAQIVALLRRLQVERGFALVFISHDLALVSSLADRTVVMYAGQVVEEGGTRELFARPTHPYTTGLVAASRSLEHGAEELVVIPGHVEQPKDFPVGCRFQSRCALAGDECTVSPDLWIGDGRNVACHHPRRIDDDYSSEILAV